MIPRHGNLSWPRKNKISINFRTRLHLNELNRFFTVNLFYASFQWPSIAQNINLIGWTFSFYDWLHLATVHIVYIEVNTRWNCIKLLVACDSCRSGTWFLDYFCKKANSRNVFNLMDIRLFYEVCNVGCNVLHCVHVSQALASFPLIAKTVSQRAANQFLRRLEKRL